ncbi:MAG: polysaccharide biosynthesis tyrosine autokinase [Deltaproteobacteria bacterium]|nr:polysaccharide biosynthesis tyrosine autokinase [Deltaproteobacteria bacterium]MBW1903700.1 polysaccharide biosynthesis tyrosine autokinase [Deltaproteobacteria bacterium]MBW2158817.1 polysaccharide biosynthesis tyrosine autokinase [Deltaproteobacteria bacterium]MBW2585466.1 polysaccharide biosynthesis tyrosine autokinase [Deltaproteobacteria bacterium]MBW2685920.1 polysaccharide biosynthesis tyrosine autokinase [Deltaproteobacteria bacterium]
MEEPEFDLREIVHILREYKWLMGAITIAVIAIGVVWTLRTPKIYEATCTIEYDPDPSKPLGGRVEDVADPIGSFWATREFFQTQNLVIASRGIAERVVRKLGLHEDPTYLTQDDDTLGETGNLEGSAIALQSRLTVDPVPETRIVRVHVLDVKPERAKLIADAVAQAYVEKTIEDRLESTDRARDWLEHQLSTLRAELDEAETVLHEFKKGHNVLSVSMEDRQNLVASDIRATNDKLTETRNRRIELEARSKRLRVSLGDGLDTIDPAVLAEDPVLSELVVELRGKKQERDALAVKYGREHPTMKTLAEEVEGLEGQVAQEKTLVIRSADHDVQQIKAVEEGLRAAASVAHSAGLNLNLREIEYKRLNHDRDNKAKLYEIVLQRLTETDLTRMLKTTYVRVLDRALLPVSPVSPNLMKNVGTASLAGLLLSLAVAFVASRLDHTVRSVEAVENLGVTVLGVIPHLGSAAGSTSSDARAGPKQISPPTAREELIVVDEPMSPAAETFRMIRTNLTFMSVDDPLRSFVVTSALPLEGKTTVASNLAISLAQFGRSVLLVDSDLRRPRLHRVLEVDNDRGLTTVVDGSTTLNAAVHETKVDGLSVLTSGPIPPNPSELLHSAAFGRLNEDVLKHFDYVVFDSPPMGAVTDAAILGSQVDGVLLVVRAGASTLHAVLGATKQLRSVSARLLGAVLNDADLRIRGTRYGDNQYAYRTAYGYAPVDEGADAA